MIVQERRALVGRLNGQMERRARPARPARLRGGIMKRARWLMLAALGVAMMIPSATAIADGTPGVFSGSLEPVEQAAVAAYAVVDADTDAAIRALLVSYNGCVAKYGAAGAYAFFLPGIQTVELIYLGVFNPQPVETPAADGTPDGMAPVQRVPQLSPKTIVVLPDGRVGAVVAAPQAGTDEALVVLVQ